MANIKCFNNQIKSSHTKLWLLVLVLFINNVASKSNATESLQAKGRRIFSDFYRNGTFNTGNSLWDGILNQCTVKPSISCLQKNVYNYIDDSLGMNRDIRISDGVCFKKNNVDVSRFSDEADEIYKKGSKEESEGRSDDEENEIEDDLPETPLEEVTDALYDKSVKFLVTHDMQIQLPELFFHGATLRLSPRALTKTGALVHIDLEPKVQEEGRLFFIQKIKKYLKRKLVMAAIAIILVVKLIALKLIFVLPIILGVTTAKKMFLKLLLFLFPALSHIFKLCSWYHQNYHTTKYHHHHHLITHHHHKPPGHHPYSHPAPHSSVAVHPQTHHETPSFEHYPQDWELSGPGLGNEYISGDIHRNAISNFKPHVNDGNDIKAWGLALPPGPSSNVGDYGAAPSNVNVNVIKGGLSGGKIVNGRPMGPPPVNPYFRNNKKNTPKDPIDAEKEALIRAANLAARVPPSPVRDEILRVSAAKLSETNRVKAETDLIKQQQEILAAQDPETIAAERFYGALVERVDNILSPMSTEQGCRERAICSLYKEPFKLTPYSNLVSNELSKDSSELIPAADSKMALRYYNYVQAARDGQESKDCVAIYPNCHINFLKK